MRKAHSAWVWGLAVAALVAASGLAWAGADSATGKGTVNTVKAAERKINVSHEPIAELGWPAMTMDFPVAESVSLEKLKPGDRIRFHVRKLSPASFEIDSLEPAKP